RRHLVSPLFPYTTLFRSLEIVEERLFDLALGFGANMVDDVDQQFHQLVGDFLRAKDAVGGEQGRADGFGDSRTSKKARMSARCRSEEHTSELQSLRHLVC